MFFAGWKGNWEETEEIRHFHKNCKASSKIDIVCLKHRQLNETFSLQYYLFSLMETVFVQLSKYLNSLPFLMRQAWEKIITTSTNLLPGYLICWFKSTFLKVCLSPTEQWNTNLNAIANSCSDIGRNASALQRNFGIQSSYCKSYTFFKSEKLFLLPSFTIW